MIYQLVLDGGDAIMICPYCGNDNFEISKYGERYGNCCDQCAIKIGKNLYAEAICNDCKCGSFSGHVVDKEDGIYIECKKCKSERIIYKKISDSNILENVSFELVHNKPKITKHEEPKIRCPKCSSTSISTGSRGYSLAWGFIGANKTTNRCANCGYSWQPKR